MMWNFTVQAARLGPRSLLRRKQTPAIRKQLKRLYSPLRRATTRFGTSRHPTKYEVVRWFAVYLDLRARDGPPAPPQGLIKVGTSVRGANVLSVLMAVRNVDEDGV